MSTELKCSHCGQAALRKADKRGTLRKPNGWQELASEMFCLKCWKARFCIRAITFPIVSVQSGEGWDQLNKAAGACFETATRLMNWLSTELRKADIVRMPEMKKLPPFVTPYLYPLARKICPELDSQSVVSLCNRAISRYRADRWKVVWMGAAALSGYKYPQPYPIPAAGWSARYLSETERAPIISVRLAGHRFELRLRSGHEFKRHLSAFALLMDGKAKPGEMQISRRNHRGGELMAKLVLWLPRRENEIARAKIVSVTTDPDSLLIGSESDRNVWRFNADHVRRLMQMVKHSVEAHDRRLMRLREDAKLGRRTGEMDDPKLFREKLCRKQNNRLDSICHQAASAAVKYAVRHGATHLNYDDTDRSFAEHFAWAKLRTLMEQKTWAAGLEYTGPAAGGEKNGEQ